MLFVVQIGSYLGGVADEHVARLRAEETELGGNKTSGYGGEQGAEALENYTQYKTMWANFGAPRATRPGSGEG